MNEQPVSYLQTDPKWGGLDYSAPGEKTTIKASGCGPTAMAMVLATWADDKVTPQTECAWALKNGHKAPHSGTYYGYFVPAAKRYGLKCTQLSWTNIYGNSTSPLHKQAKEAVDSGNFVIACMGKGNWTSSGHYVLLWGVDQAKDIAYINDPASTLTRRTRGSWVLFKQQVKYYWVIERPAWKKEEEQEEEMDIAKLINEMTDEQAYLLLQKAARYEAKEQEPVWSQVDGHWARAKEKGITDGERPCAPMKRCEVIAVLGRAGMI